MQVDTGVFEALAERVEVIERTLADAPAAVAELIRIAREAERQDRQDRIAGIMATAGLPPPPPPPKRDRHGMRLIGGGKS